MPLPAPDVTALFTLGTVYDCGNGKTATVSALPEAALSLPSGRVAACDPFLGLGEELNAFADEVEPGAYPVVLSLLAIAREGSADAADQRVAAAWLRVSERPAAEWTLALCDGQTHEELGDVEFFGFGVDAGAGCFVDATLSTELGPLLGEDGDDLIDLMYGTPDSPARTPAVLTDPATGHNVIAYPSGWGDGCYPTWIGRTPDGEVTGFVTEFFVAPQPSRDHLAE